MLTGKVIKSNGVSVTLGFEDGSLRDIPRDQMDFFAQDGSQVDVYESDGKTVYVQHKGGSFGAGNMNDTLANAQVMFKGDQVVISKAVYILLAFFLGGIGAHKFATKKYVQGVLYLVFFWTFIPGLIALIELIRCAVAIPADENGNIVM